MYVSQFMMWFKVPPLSFGLVWTCPLFYELILFYFFMALQSDLRQMSPCQSLKHAVHTWNVPVWLKWNEVYTEEWECSKAGIPPVIENAWLQFLLSEFLSEIYYNYFILPGLKSHLHLDKNNKFKEEITKVEKTTAWGLESKVLTIMCLLFI